MTSFLCVRTIALGGALALVSLAAQTAPTPLSAPEAETIELSPFEVNSQRDVGYLAENTLAGSRLNTKLRDTAASVSVFTKEFLEDLGIANLGQLVEYSLNAEIDTESRTSGANQNAYINGQNLNNNINIRGISANQGIDNFLSIAPIDSYRASRFDASRGPNSILFGIGNVGGLINQSSKSAVTYRDFNTVRVTGSSWGGHRAELDINRVLVRQRLAVEVAGVHQNYGGWRDYDFRDRRRVFTTMTARPFERLTLKAAYESGRDENAVLKTSSEAEEMLAWLDQRTAKGVDAVTFTPTTANVNAAQIALGVTTRNGAAGGSAHRLVYLENTGTLFDAIGTYLTGTYNNAAVVAPDGTTGRTGGTLRLNDPALYPYRLNAGGPGMRRSQTLRNHTVSADFQATSRLFFNLAHNRQETDALLYLMTGASPVLRGEPNRTLGIGGPANPFVGRLYFDGDWNRDHHRRLYEESRLSASYTWEPAWTWLGRHRAMGLLSRSRDDDERVNSQLVLAGRPFNADPINVNNRVTVRHYLTEGDFGTYRAGDWRAVPETLTVLGRTYATTWAHQPSTSGSNGAARQETDTLLAVLQSHVLRDRLVTTFGYREDRATVSQAGYSNDFLLGDVLDWDLTKRKSVDKVGRTKTAGAVLHVTDGLSLLANRSTSIGVPSFNRTVFPRGELAEPPTGRGADYGVNVSLLRGRLDAKVVYFETSERGRPGAGTAVASFNNRNRRIMDAFATVLVGPGRPLTTEAWSQLYTTYTPPISGTLSDFESSGWEGRLTANLTANWRLVLNASKTNAVRANYSKDALPWYGLLPDGHGLLRQGVRQDPATGLFVVADPGAYAAGGTIAKWIELGQLTPAADLSRLQTAGITPPATVAQEIYNLTAEVNESKQDEEQRWGLRPYRANLFTAYDCKTGWAKGLTIGGGWRWRSANVIGQDAAGRELRGRALSSVDALLRYALKPARLAGRLSFQLNVSNVLGQGGIVPSRLLVPGEAYQLPYGHGLAYSRYDLIDPREWRLTTTWEF